MKRRKIMANNVGVVLNGTENADWLNGTKGNDTLIGNDGNDYLVGWGGADVLNGGNGDDRYYVDSPGDKIIDSGGRDYVYSSVNFKLTKDLEVLTLSGNAIFAVGNKYANQLVGNSQNNIIDGRGGDDQLYGKDGNDILFGGAGNDYLSGGTDRDLMIGGRGDDVYEVDNIKDVIIEKRNKGYDRVVSSVNYTLSANIEKINLIENAVIAKGNASDNKLFGNANDNILKGKKGNDTLIGAEGNDTLKGGKHNDYLDGGKGDDFINAGKGDDKLYAGEGNDYLVGKKGNDYLQGDLGNDTYLFNAGDGLDIIAENASDSGDRVLFGKCIKKEDIAFFADGNDLKVKYGKEDVINVISYNTPANTIETFEVDSGLSADVNAIINHIATYETNNSVNFSNIEDLSNDAQLMQEIQVYWS